MAALAVGQLIGHYRVTREISRGGMGVVYEAVQERIGQRAAVKVLHAAAPDPTAAARFLDEARAASIVRHPGLVQIFDFGHTEDGAAYLLMEFLDGGSLRQRLQAHGALPPGTAARLAHQIADALCACHRHGIIHRDLKPENIMLVRDPAAVGGERAKVLDFGIAKFLAAEVARTRSGVVLGSAAYMAPEQCRGERALTAAADVYALGVMLYELLSGETPFTGPRAALLQLHLFEAPPPIGDEAPPALQDLVQRMLRKPPALRPAMADVAAALAEAAEALPVFDPPPPGSAAALPSPATRSGPALALVPTPPQEFDEYRILRPLGQGGMGQVFLGQDTLLDRPVAIKFIAAADPDATARERLLTEARAIARLRHPNVVGIYRVGEVAGRPYLAYEFVRGDPLDRLPRPMPWERALAIGIGLARGLGAAHRQGVLHRDIKPHNAILCEDGEVKLLDFGLAKLARSEDLARGETEAAPGALALDRTQAGALLGTPAYMAPEIWRGEAATARSDLYSLGALLYELCTGAPPHPERTLDDLAHAVLHTDPPPLLTRVPALPPRFAALVERCLRRDPAERPTSAEEVAHALEQSTGAARAQVPAGNPYRGLAAFQAEDRALFCGRGAEVHAVISRLRTEPMVLIAGDSGVGKSSLCRAGVLPALCEAPAPDGRRYAAVTLVPGRRPLAALADALQPTLPDAAERALRGDSAGFPRALRRALQQDGGVVLFIDQMEELCTLSDPAEAAQLCGILAQLADRVPGVRVLLSARGDFLARLAELPGLAALLPPILYFLSPLSPAGLRDAIVEPALRTGVHFESEALVAELVQTGAGTAGGLPLLQFALSLLWEARDPERQVIPSAALAAIGGVAGALARHADGVIKRLLPAERQAARRILERLVTPQGTRARRRAEELIGDGAAERAALEALVQGRLLVARNDDGGDARYEVAHEALLQGWGTLREWLSRDAERRAARERVEAAAGEWTRLGRRREALFGRAQLDEVGAAGLGAADLSAGAAAFLQASRGEARRRRALRAGAALALPLLVGGSYGGFAWRGHRQAAAQVARHIAEAEAETRRALATDAEIEQGRRDALARFDQGDDPGGEARWAQVIERVEAVHEAFSAAERALERALALQPGRGDVRRRLAQVLYEHALRAERDHRAAQRDDLIGRAEAHDPGGPWQLAWRRPARLSLTVTPPGAAVTLARYEAREGRRDLVGLRDLGRAPLAEVEVPPGSYLLTVTAAGRAPLRYPVLLGRGEVHQAALTPPAASPPGMVYVPAGRFLFGSAEEETMRRDLLRVPPLHEVRTAAYLIGRTEVTYGDYLPYLRALPAQERAARRPRSVDRSRRGDDPRRIELREVGEGDFELIFQPTSTAYRARVGERLRYPGRARRAEQDWLRLPVTGISIEDARAYAAWLARTGRVPRARLCNEYEWERGARGADYRLYPHGDALAPDDTNHDATYGREALAFGLDEVGSHPASESPFGLMDMAGNAWEWVEPVTKAMPVLFRGGGFYEVAATGRCANREAGEPTLRDLSVGLRICADP
jgi:serine/threonine protein kinase/formylglycine-generating enzyme required for sulfatase activity